MDASDSYDAATPTPRPRLPSLVGDGGYEPDTCRICRGEATPEEPLFYPCKCSGSIKYVHQDCLMEWLSHSQKKHCELCKTSFRFTKLYAPTMPKQLPLLIFVRHLAKYFVRNVLVWLRIGLVASVWLGWLPYLTRWEWSFFFWVSEEGLVAPQALLVGTDGLQANATGIAAAGAAAAAATAEAALSVCPSSPLFAAPSAVTAVSAAVEAAHAAANASLAATTTTSAAVAPLISLVTGFLIDLVVPGDFVPSAANRTWTAAAGSFPRTLLSDVGFLRSLTRYNSLNWAIIYALEGQIITVLVIVCCVLVILVRDYVVQQQPEINMRAAFAAAGGPVVAADDLRQQRIANVLEILDENGEEDEEEEDDDGTDWEMGSQMSGDDAFHVPTAPNQTVPQPPPRAEEFHPVVWTEPETTLAEPPIPTAPTAPAGPTAPTVPTVPTAPTYALGGPDGDFMTPPPTRDSTEGSGSTDGASVQEYLRVYREARGDPDEMRRIARAENMEDRLGYWLRLTQQVAEKNRQEQMGSSEASGSRPGTGSLSGLGSASGADVDARNQDRADAAWAADWPWGDEGGSSSSRDGSGQDSGPPAPHDDNDKGKERADEETADMSIFGGGLRPRAHTDGPQRMGGMHPLAYNTWSFPAAEAQEGEQGRQGREEQEQEQEQEASENREEELLTQVDNEGSWDDVSPESTETYADTRVDTPAPDEAQTAAEADGAHTDETHDETHADTHDDETNADAHADDTQEADTGGRGPQRAAAARPGNWAQRAADFMWRDLDNIDPLELMGGQDGLFEIEDGPFDVGELGEMGPFEADGEVLDAAAAAGLDAEALEDAEDLEGLLEILGMRGPVAALFQNAVFCGFLVTLTLLLGVFLPYNVGRVAAWVLANPLRPVMLVFGLARLLQDLAMVAVGGGLYGLLRAAGTGLQAGRWLLGAGGGGGADDARVQRAVEAAWRTAAKAAVRVAGSVRLETPVLSAGEMRNFSAISHAALLVLKGEAGRVAAAVGQTALFVVGGDYGSKAVATARAAGTAATATWTAVRAVPAWLVRPNAWVISLEGGGAAATLDAALAAWNGTDRFLATVLGYAALCVAAGLYLRRGTPFSSGATGQAWEAAIMEGLGQASGVLKVMLIIGIEMLVFPLYCGILLDMALLPLFEAATVRSRAQFAAQYPLTSVFVHWFVGTGYMFHFALFVSMCRKIMRRGVLYFIRDPDDPEFHPVRDVLERHVATQLRKILFSAFVYGALVVVCLGGVVWGLAAAAPGVLPIHYASDEPVLEFPVDLLFYNSLMPLAIRFFRPSDGLHAMYTWWFRQSARALRLSWFLFGERRLEEEGALVLPPNSPLRRRAWWRRAALEVTPDDGDIVPRTWSGALAGGTARPRSALGDDEMGRLAAHKTRLMAAGLLVPSGRFVWAPASDQVKIPKGRAVFVEAGDAGRLMGDDMLRGIAAAHYRYVYVPPRFRLRVMLFIGSIWLFAAATGVACTIVPLLFGRRAFRLLLPAHIRTNDIYAFSIGIYVLGVAAYGLWHARALAAMAARGLRRSLTRWPTVARQAAAAAAWTARLVYAYSFLLGVFPLLATALVELYVLIPLHTWEEGSEGPSSLSPTDTMTYTHTHTIRLVQSWTLGLLYLKLAARTVTSWHDGARLAAAVRAVLRRGPLDPDVGLLTRAFVVPGLLLGAGAVAAPLALAHAVTTQTAWGAATAATLAGRRLVFRLAFPAVALAAAGAWALWGMAGVLGTWRMRIRDEAYLVGERLHNFGGVARVRRR